MNNLQETSNILTEATSMQAMICGLDLPTALKEELKGASDEEKAALRKIRRTLRALYRTSLKAEARQLSDRVTAYKAAGFTEEQSFSLALKMVGRNVIEMG